MSKKNKEIIIIKTADNSFPPIKEIKKIGFIEEKFIDICDKPIMYLIEFIALIGFFYVLIFM